MSRDRPFVSLKECVNPEYINNWGSPVTVKDVIDDRIRDVVRRAFKRHNRGYQVRLLLPPDYNGRRSIVTHIFMSLKEEVSSHGIIIELGNERELVGDLVIHFVPLTLHPQKLGIPVCWKDDLKDWTWNDVVSHGGLYASSSKDVWPPEEYRMRAQRERLQRMAEERRTRSNPFA